MATADFVFETMLAAEEGTKTRWVRETWPDFDAYLQDLKRAGTTERVIIIIACTMLDLALRRLLIASMADEAKLAEELLGSEDGGGERPLGSFSARIKACRAFELISANERTALEVVRKIRNAYAHKLSHRISEQSLDDLVAQLSNLLLPPYAKSASVKADGRHAVLLFCLVPFTTSLGYRVSSVRRCKPCSWDVRAEWETELQRAHEAGLLPGSRIA